MCDHRACKPFAKTDPPSTFLDRDHCNIYYLHRDGNVKRHENIAFRDPITGDVASSFCGDDRLTLVHFQARPLPPQDEKNNTDVDSKKKPECLKDFLKVDDIPTLFKNKLEKICEHCKCKQGLLWNNFLREEQHFDACFRYVNKDETDAQRRCFLKLYTLRVPFLSDQTISFSIVHHIRAQGGKFDHASGDKRVDGYNQEHMFGFLYGLDGSQIQELLTGLVSRWADIIDDHKNNLSTGITPRLFVAAVMSQYGAVVAAKIKDVYTELLECDGVLQKAILPTGQEQETALSTNQLDLKNANFQIQKINDKLIELNRQLTGTRSTMHYLAESADTMVNYITNFEEYVEARLDEWHTTSEKNATRKSSSIERAPTFNISLKDALKELDSFREKTRDHDKLVIVRKTMFQYKTDIKSLQQHININVSMVTNLIAVRDRAIQIEIMSYTRKDGRKMSVIAFLTALLLPGTFAAIFLTTPMFNFVEDTKPVLTKNGVPLWVYCGFTVTGFVVLLITNSYLNESGIFSKESKAKADTNTSHIREIAPKKGRDSLDQNHVQPGKQAILVNDSDKHSISKENISRQISEPGSIV